MIETVVLLYIRLLIAVLRLENWYRITSVVRICNKGVPRRNYIS